MTTRFPHIIPVKIPQLHCGYDLFADESNGTNSLQAMEPAAALVPVSEVMETLEDDLKAKIDECRLEGERLDLGECIGVGA